MALITASAYVDRTDLQSLFPITHLLHLLHFCFHQSLPFATDELRQAIADFQECAIPKIQGISKPLIRRSSILGETNCSALLLFFVEMLPIQPFLLNNY